jgi:hypothetical protein
MICYSLTNVEILISVLGGVIPWVNKAIIIPT